MRDLLELPIVGDVRGRGFFWAIERVKDDANTRFDQGERDRLLARGSSQSRARRGHHRRADDRGDSVLQIAPPLISDQDLLDQIVDTLAGVLTDAAAHMRYRTPYDYESRLATK